MKKSYTTEFVMFDGSCGVQGTQTAISGTYGNFNMNLAPTYAGGSSTATLATLGSSATSAAVKGGVEATFTTLSNDYWAGSTAYGYRPSTGELSTQGPSGFIRPFSAGSALNQGVYFAPTLLKHTIFNGSFIDFSAITNKP